MISKEKTKTTRRGTRWKDQRVVYVKQNLWEELGRVAIDEGTSKSALIEKAIAMLLIEKGRINEGG